MLDFEGSVEDTFGQTFEVEMESQLGERIPVQLKPEGNLIPVTNENCRGRDLTCIFCLMIRVCQSLCANVF